MGFFTSKKSKFSSTATEYTHGPEFSKERNSGYSSLALLNLEKKDVKYKKRIRILRLTTRTISLILSSLMIGTLSYTLANYFTTRHIQISNADIWNGPKILWPTYLILSISTLTFILNAGTLMAYICSVQAANKTGDLTIFTGYLMLAIEVIAWAVSSSLYKMADTGADLWGYSCSETADQMILNGAKSFVNFGNLCTAQNGTWVTTIVQAVLHFLTLVTLVIAWKRGRGKKRVQMLRESQLLSEEYTPNV